MARIDRLEEALGQLAAAQERTEARVAELVAALRDLAVAQTRTETQLGTLLSWQRGEDGRRRGEQLERRIQRSAPTLFGGGEGGATDQPDVRRRLSALLAAILDRDIAPEDDPFLADLVWWKGDRVALVEVSLVVDEHDVERSHRRAETLRRAGSPSLPMLIGDGWADGTVRALADAHRAGWHVGGEVSDTYIAFRRLPASSTPADGSG